MALKEKLVASGLALTLVLSLAAGCAPQRRPTPTPPPGATTPAPARRPAADLKAQSARIARWAAEVKGVKRATAIVSGSTAYVGIEVPNNTPTTRLDGIKREVARKIMRNDRRITGVMVTADSKLFTKINNIADAVARGKPISAFNREIMDLSRRMAPTIR